MTGLVVDPPVEPVPPVVPPVEPPVDPPVSANVAGGAATAGLIQYEGGDHWVALDVPDAHARIRGFFETMVADGVPTIPPSP